MVILCHQITCNVQIGCFPLSVEELLRNVAVLLDRVLDNDSQLLEEWSSREFVEAVCEAMQQTRLASTMQAAVPAFFS